MPDLRARLQSTFGGKFRIVRELTGGGMSRVFLAEDVELERDVVVKVLAPDLVDETGLQRFRQEVLQTARLQHPTIVSLFDVGAIDDGKGHRLPFYVMPYVRGESLRSRLTHEGSLSVGTAVRILRSVLDALAYAHAHGVVHRDIKPENIFISGTSAVVADFGIAKAVSGPRTPAGTTSPGTAVGTPSYMPPEQLAGDQSADQRADLYSVGVIAFEMLTGRLPWDGTSTAEMLAAQARAEIQPIAAHRADVPRELAVVIERCLAWDPSRRPESAMEVLRVVEAAAFTPTTPTTPPRVIARRMSRPLRWSSRPRVAIVATASIAAIVLALFVGSRLNDPTSGARSVRLAVLYPDWTRAADDSLSKQLYDNLLTSLGPVAGLSLRNRVGISRMAEQGLSMTQIADSLRAAGVDSVLAMVALPASDGSYWLSVEMRRLTTGARTSVAGPMSLRTLNRVSPDSARKLTHFLSGQIASALHLISANMSVSETESLESWWAWRDGHEAYRRRTPDAFRAAVRYLERALELDPLYAQAHAELAQVLALSTWYRYRGETAPYARLSDALRHSNRAIELQPSVAEGYTARAYIGMIAGAPVDYVEQQYAEAAKRSPDNPSFGSWRAGVLALRGRHDDAVGALEEQVQLEPRSPSTRLSFSLYSLTARKYGGVVRGAVEARGLEPGIPFTSGLELWGRVLLGTSELNRCVALPAGPYLGARAACLGLAQGPAQARRVIDSLLAIVTASAPIDSTFDLSLYLSEAAQYHAFRKEWGEAQRWLRDAFGESPIGIDFRFLRSGLFNPELETLGDSLRRKGWERISAAAAQRGEVVHR